MREVIAKIQQRKIQQRKIQQRDIQRPSLRFLLIVLGISLVAAPEINAQHNYLFGRNKIQHEDFEWHVLTTDHFDIYYYPEMKELAGIGANFAEEAYADLQNRFNYSLTERVPLIFYSSNLHFKQTNITPGFIPDGVGGFFEFLKGRVVIPSNGDLHRFRRVVRHEMVHVFTFMRFLRAMRDHRKRANYMLPLWFTEGLAEHWSGEPNFQHGMMMRDAIYSNYLVPLSDFYRIRGTFQMYKQGESVCAYIAQRFGEEKLLELITNAWKSEDFRDVMEAVLAVPFEELERDWEEWVRAKYYPELEERELSSLISTSLSYRGFSSKPVFYRMDDGTRMVYFVGNRTGYTNIYALEVDENYEPVGEAEVLVRGERTSRFESFHLLESRLSVSDDGKLAFVTKSGGRDVIHVYDLEAAAMGATYAFDDLVGVYSPTWSPDGTRIAFSSIDRSGFSDLYIYNIQTDGLRRLSDDVYDDSAPDWGPDGRYLAFSSDRAALGKDGAYNLFLYDLNDGAIQYLTSGPYRDASPRWSPDGKHIIFTRVAIEGDDVPSAQNVWTIGVNEVTGEALAAVGAPAVGAAPVPADGRRALHQLTDLTTAAFDPVWTPGGHVLYASFEDRRFSVRQIGGIDSLMSAPAQVEHAPLVVQAPQKQWTYESRGEDDGVTRSPYERSYSLDVARGQFAQTPVWGGFGGAMLAFSDMLGDDHWYVSMYSSPDHLGGRSILERLNFSVARVQLQGRANVAYGIHRFSGRRFDLTDPNVNEELPFLYETLYGGFGAVSYPLSMFRRIELTTSLNWSRKKIPFADTNPNNNTLDFGQIDQKAILLSNQIAFVHDNALYGLNGPVTGWRAHFAAGYTTDVWHSYESYYSLSADVRNYWRIVPGVTFASRFMVRYNDGRRARLNLLGGSWSLRGWDLFDVRGKKLWFTSHELRFPIVRAPSYFIPLLAPFGITSLRGALFVDAAHAWNEDYNLKIEDIYAGETLGALGGGLRLNLFGGLVLRYDVGWRYRDGFTDRGEFFKQFFFGYDF